MAGEHYKGKIEHTEKTIEQLYKARYHAYEKLKMLLRLVLAVALIFAAAFSTFHIIVKGIILLIGAWLLVSMDFPAQMQADRVIQTRKAALPNMEYDFHPDRVAVSGEGSMTIAYKKFKKLTCDANYLYMFTSAQSVCMIDRESIRPKDVDGFMKFISEKTGLEWKSDKSFFSMNIYDLKEIFQELKRK